MNSEQLLVKELIAGNEKAFRKLFDTYRNPLYKFCLSMVYSKEYAEEIVQEVFLKVWMKRETLNPELSFKAYIYTITRNDTIKFLRKAANDLKLREEIFYQSQKSVNPTEARMREKELENLKRKALEQLPPKRRQIFEMSRNEGKSYDDIAKELGLSVNTVRNQMSMALSTLRNFLVDHNNDITLSVLVLVHIWL